MIGSIAVSADNAELYAATQATITQLIDLGGAASAIAGGTAPAPVLGPVGWVVCALAIAALGRRGLRDRVSP